MNTGTHENKPEAFNQDGFINTFENLKKDVEALLVESIHHKENHELAIDLIKKSIDDLVAEKRYEEADKLIAWGKGIELLEIE